MTTQALRIIIAEDDALIAMDLADLLTGMGHEVCAAVRSEADAVAAALRFTPDLMIVDGNLDGGSGFAAMRAILAHGFVAHLYLTGSASEMRRLDRDAVVVSKPFTLAELVEGIARARSVLPPASVQA